MTTSTTRAADPAASGPSITRGRRAASSSRSGSGGVGAERPSLVATGILVLGALYSLIPIVWVLFAASKSADEL